MNRGGFEPSSPLYAIADREVLARYGREPEQWAEMALSAGAGCLQWRDKTGDFHSSLDLLGRLRRLCESAKALFIINDRVDICLAVNAHGVHLGQSDLPPRLARRLLGERAIIGFSTHSAAQIKEALREPVDYLAFGPVYATSTKERADPVQGIAGLAEAVKLAGPMPVVAIGGITAERAEEVFSAGAVAAAVISDLISAADVQARGQDYRLAWEKVRRK